MGELTYRFIQRNSIKRFIFKVFIIIFVSSSKARSESLCSLSNSSTSRSSTLSKLVCGIGNSGSHRSSSIFECVDTGSDSILGGLVGRSSLILESGCSISCILSILVCGSLDRVDTISYSVSGRSSSVSNRVESISCSLSGRSSSVSNRVDTRGSSVSNRVDTRSSSSFGGTISRRSSILDGTKNRLIRDNSFILIIVIVLTLKFIIEI